MMDITLFALMCVFIPWLLFMGVILFINKNNGILACFLAIVSFMIISWFMMIIIGCGMVYIDGDLTEVNSQSVQSIESSLLSDYVYTRVYTDNGVYENKAILVSDLYTKIDPTSTGLTLTEAKLHKSVMWCGFEFSTEETEKKWILTCENESVMNSIFKNNQKVAVLGE